MNERLTETFSRLRTQKRKALVPFLVSGYPTRARFREILRETSKHADVLEIGIPFSDPLADGPTIQAASSKALANGTTLDRTFADIAESAYGDGPPLVFMITYNQILAAKPEAFAIQCREHGVAGVIVPDLPFEEASELRATLTKYNVALIAMIAPTTSEARAKQIAASAQGFIYLISVAGTTGARGEFAPATIDYIKRTRKLTDKPLCVGFGISKREHIAQLREHADGFIVGSALVNAIDEGKEAALLFELRNACM